MKKIINGRMYDTETAETVAEASHGGVRDFRYYREELHRKKDGEFFLFGEGGGLSKYAHKSEYGGFEYGEAITPLTEEDARRWMERNASVEEYCEVFGTPAEDAETPNGSAADSAPCTVPELLKKHGMTQTGFARRFNIPLRTVQHWCLGERSCPPYVIAMAAEILAAAEK